jgi:precorrin-6B methylase 2
LEALALQQGQKIADIGAGGGRFSFHRKFGHYVPKEIIIAEMKEAGYRLEKDLSFLPEQSFVILSLLE